MKLLLDLEQNFILEHPVRAAKALEDLPVEEQVDCLESIESKLFVLLVKNMSLPSLAKCLVLLSQAKQNLLVARLQREAKIKLFRLIDHSKRAEILAKLPDKVATPILTGLRIIPNAASELLSTAIFSTNVNSSIKKVISEIKSTSLSVNKYVYVRDDEGRLVGVTTLKKILISSPTTKVQDILTRETNFIYDTATIWEIEDPENWKKYHIIPVVDQDKLFLGVIKLEDIYKVKTQYIKKQRRSVAPLVSLIELMSVSLFSILNTIFSGNSNKSSKSEANKK